jgi:hypothetical protein
MIWQRFIVPGDHQVLKTPVTDAAGDILNRRIEHNPGRTGTIFPAVVAFPFLAVKPLTAKNVFAMDALSNHFFPRCFIGLQVSYPKGSFPLLLSFIIISAESISTLPFSRFL